MTLWHMGHNAGMIRQFHEYLKKAGYTPDKLLSQATPPRQSRRILLEPELMTDAQLTGNPAVKPVLGASWFRDGDLLASHLGHNGPVVNIPLRIPSVGLYRMWIQYYAKSAIVNMQIYRAGREELGPIFQQDEIYDWNGEPAGPAWKDLLLDFTAGDCIIRLSHGVEWWQGITGYSNRKIDCIYLTDEIWAGPPSVEGRQAMRESARAEGIQWNFTPELAATDRESWKWWQVRPLSWEDAAANPKLFALSREFWSNTIAALSEREYKEARLPDYRLPERQVVFNENWNMIANPVRARRQIEILQGDISSKPLGYRYVWQNAADCIPKLCDSERPESYGGWIYNQHNKCLGTLGGESSGTVTAQISMKEPGKYSVWVLSSTLHLSFAAPWFAKASVDGKEQFTYHRAGTIPSVWVKMGEVAVEKPGKVEVEFKLDGSGPAETARLIYALFLVDNPAIVPQGTIRPPWTLEMYRERTAAAGAKTGEKYLLWMPADPYTPLSQEVWGDPRSTGEAWPEKPCAGKVETRKMLLTGDTNRAVQVCLRNLTDKPLTLHVKPEMLRGKKSYSGAVSWKVVAFAPYENGNDRQKWSPFFLLRRPSITIPPYNTAAVWLSIDSRNVQPGDYACDVRFSSPGMPDKTAALKIRVSTVKADPEHPVLVSGYTRPRDGEAYLRDFAEHGMNVWNCDMTKGEVMSKAEMAKWGIRLQAIDLGNPVDYARNIATVKSKGLQYEDYFCPISDEPGRSTEAELKVDYIDPAKSIRAVDPKVRISFNPGEGATLDTFKVLAPYCDFWLPYGVHLPEYGGGRAKWAIYGSKPWMWYSTPCYWDKSPKVIVDTYGEIRSIPARPGRCVGTAFFALEYPWRDPWDTAYEHIPDASTMGSVQSRHGPVPTRTWEAIREAIEHANLAMLVRERLGVATFDEVIDPALCKLVTDGSREELILWLEQHPAERKGQPGLPATSQFRP